MIRPAALSLLLGVVACGVACGPIYDPPVVAATVPVLPSYPPGKDAELPAYVGEGYAAPSYGPRLGPSYAPAGPVIVDRYCSEAAAEAAAAGRRAAVTGLPLDIARAERTEAFLRRDC